MSAAQEEVAAVLSEQTWQQLLNLEALHRELLRSHERVQRTLDEAVLAPDRDGLLVVWNEYRAVVADLCRVTVDIGSLRLMDA
ncbi:MAG: hypothetical protein WDO12_09490 [Pseudomonadota bacterium]